MALTSKDIQRIAHLARLEISENETDDYVEKLSQILELVDQLKKVDTADILPMAHPLNMSQRLRQDEPREPNQRELFQRNATDTDQGLYTVPRVIE